jgi:hypothetical protein
MPGLFLWGDLMENLIFCIPDIYLCFPFLLFSCRKQHII